MKEEDLSEFVGEIFAEAAAVPTSYPILREGDDSLERELPYNPGQVDYALDLSGEIVAVVKPKPEDERYR